MWAHIVKRGTERAGNKETDNRETAGQSQIHDEQEEGRRPNEGDKEEEQQNEPTNVCALVSPTTAAEKQHVEDANIVKVSCEMGMETTREHTEELEEREIEQDWTSPNDNKSEAERDIDKIGGKT
jgi:hypothetical protein